MKTTIIVGGQYGSEGKGKTALYFAKKQNADVVVRSGGANSGHTVEGLVFNNLPGASLCGAISLVSAGSFINVKKLLAEIKKIPGKVFIDPKAVCISNDDKKLEIKKLKSISSTCSGSGASLINKLWRQDNIIFAKDAPELKSHIADTIDIMYSAKRLIIEGTQGFGLSLHHSLNYPYVTSRDTTAGSFLSEIGISPLTVDTIVLVCRTKAIRVAGNSGPLEEETSWEDLNLMEEYTTVTKKIRRVGGFQHDLVKRAIKINQPTDLVLNHCDYIDSSQLKKLKDQYKFNLFGFGPSINDFK
jgi:adenylosuccinate synthase